MVACLGFSRGPYNVLLLPRGGMVGFLVVVSIGHAWYGRFSFPLTRVVLASGKGLSSDGYTLVLGLSLEASRSI